MIRNAINVEPRFVAVDICRVIKRTVPDRSRLRDLAHQLLRRHDLLQLRPIVSSEETVEAYFRCVITDRLAERYGLGLAAIPSCINSSHRAVRRVCASPAHRHASIEDDTWRRGWMAIQRGNPEVNIPVAGGSPKRADLYIVAAGGIVSVEFKYVGVQGLRDVRNCGAQLGRHAAHHAEAILLLYSAAVVPTPVARQLAEEAGANDVHIVNVIGPEVPVARSAA